MKQWISKHTLLTVLISTLLAVAISVSASVLITTRVVQGTPGPQGAPGADGINGENGKDGVDGINGVNGVNGVNGADGRDGANGADGKSAYEIAVANGFEGSEQDWLASLKGSASEGSDKGYLVVTDYFPANTDADVSDALQKLIDENPNRTIFFPDGVYILAKPVATSANPVNAVSFQLSNFAVIKAADTWDSNEAMIRLGAAEPFNNITTNGSNYSFFGGIVDGSGVANGIAIESGRGTAIRNVSIKNTQVGIHIKSGANGNSSDADIDTVNIVGNQDKRSIGVLIEGNDNTLTNMRIAYVKTGVHLRSSSNYLTNIHPLGSGSLYAGSVAFMDEGTSNRYFRCYSDQYQVGFKMGANNSDSVFDTCFCYWYSDDVPSNKQTGFYAVGQFNATIINSKVNFRSDTVTNSFLIVGTEGGNGTIIYPHFNEARNSNESYQDYLDTKVLP